MCTRAACALDHHIESEGVATTVISLVREHSTVICPPRALWVPFEFGRLLGAPDDAEFQLDVLRALLALFARTDLPVHEDYPLEAPAPTVEDAAGWTCPLPVPAAEADASLRGQLLDEVARLRPWHREAILRRHRSSVGVSGLGHEQIEEIAELLAAVAEGNVVAAPEGASAPLPRLARYLADDAKAYYAEALSEQPGKAAASSDELGEWLYGASALGRVLFELRQRAQDSEDRAMRALRGVLVPTRFLHLEAAQANRG